MIRRCIDWLLWYGERFALLQKLEAGKSESLQERLGLKGYHLLQPLLELAEGLKGP